jgi:hypothetical protein
VLVCVVFEETFLEMGGKFETEILQRADKYVVSLGGGGGGLRGTGASVQPANHGPCFVCCQIDLIRFTGFGSKQSVCVRLNVTS